MSSQDGTNWTAQIPLSFAFNKVAFGAGKFVAVGDNNLNPYPYGGFGIISSLDGLAWGSPVSGTGFDLRGITYGLGKFVAVGSNGKTMISTDGTDWTTNSTDPNAYFRSVVFGAGRFVATGGRADTAFSQPVLYHSADGVNWTPGSVTASAPYFTLDRVGFAHGVFIILSAQSSLYGGGMIFTSFDGQQWQERHSPNTLDLTGIAADSRSFVLVNSAGAILQSSDLRPRLRLQNESGHLQLRLRGLSNAVYQVEISTNLIDWNTIATNRLGDQEQQVLETNTRCPRYFTARVWRRSR